MSSAVFDETGHEQGQASDSPSPKLPIGKAIARGGYSVGFGLFFVAELIGGLFHTEGTDERQEASPSDSCGGKSLGGGRQSVVVNPKQALAVRTYQALPGVQVFAKLSGMFVWAVLRSLEWFKSRVIRRFTNVENMACTLMERRDGVWEYALVTIAYWGITITDGAIRMLVLFQFYLMGYSAFQIASLFLFYEIFGVITNLFGGWIGANMGLRVTLFGGMALQVVALFLLALLNPAWPVGFMVAFVMVTQALSGIAKDLTKMSSKSAIKALIPNGADATMYRWVSLLTGSKNALKGAGFFVGAFLLTLIGFNLALAIMGTGLLIMLAALWRHLPAELGRTKEKQKFKSMFSMDRRINILSMARFFLFGARDVWFVIALPVYLATAFGWSPLVVGAYLALWTIGYGIIQSLAPRFISGKNGEPPKGHTALFWSAILTAVPAAIALALWAGLFPEISIIGGLAIFGVIFAINSAIHSYMIVDYAESEKVAMTIGFYYMANAGGRLTGTILSGWVYQVAGIVGCLWISTLFLGVATLITTGLAFNSKNKRVPPVHYREIIQVTF